MIRRAEHSIFPAYVVLAYTVWNWWLKTKTGHWLYFFMDYNRPFPFAWRLPLHWGFLTQTPARPSMVPTFLILVAVEVASFLAGASLADLGQ